MPWTGGRVADTILREMEAHRKRLGAQLLALRKAKGWNQEDAAHEIGVGVKTWRLWERGKTLPYDSNIRRIADVFALDPDELGVRPAPLGIGADDDAQDDRLTDRLASIEQRVSEQLAEHAAKVEALLARQSAILERIESAIGREERAVRSLDESGYAWADAVIAKYREALADERDRKSVV